MNLINGPMQYRNHSEQAMNSPCQEWKKSRDKNGYGQVNIGGKIKKAHRVTWERLFGDIPTGLQVLHKCDNPPCCNPEHLFLGTHADNHADKKAKGKGRGQTPALTDIEATNVRILAKQFSHRVTARMMSISKSTVGRIISHKTRCYK